MGMKICHQMVGGGVQVVMFDALRWAVNRKPLGDEVQDFFAEASDSTDFAEWICWVISFGKDFYRGFTPADILYRLREAYAEYVSSDVEWGTEGTVEEQLNEVYGMFYAHDRVGICSKALKFMGSEAVHLSDCTSLWQLRLWLEAFDKGYGSTLTQRYLRCVEYHKDLFLGRVKTCIDYDENVLKVMDTYKAWVQDENLSADGRTEEEIQLKMFALSYPVLKDEIVFEMYLNYLLRSRFSGVDDDMMALLKNYYSLMLSSVIVGLFNLDY